MTLVLIAAMCLCYTIWMRDFAKIHIDLPFVHIPVFVGEMLFAVCVLLWICQRRLMKAPWQVWEKAIGIYVAWLCFKVITGYMDGGTLALRHAALFYYPLFALFTFTAFQREIGRFLSYPVLVGLFVILILVRVGTGFSGEYLYPYMVCTAVITFSLLRGWWKILGFLFLLSWYPASDLLMESKSYVVGHVMAGAFVFFYFCLLLPGRLRTKILVFLLLVLAGAVGMTHYGNKVQVKALGEWSDFWVQFHEKEDYIQENKKHHTPQQLKVRLFNATGTRQFKNFDTLDGVESGSGEQESQATIPSGLNAQEVIKGQLEGNIKNALFAIKKWQRKYGLGKAQPDEDTDKWQSEKDIDQLKALLAQAQDVLSKLNSGQSTEDIKQLTHLSNDLSALSWRINEVIIPSLRTVEDDQSNMSFRLFIWRDMLEELVLAKPLMGLSLGHPQRSTSIEILNIAQGEWKRDGWITPHNSYLHLIYRGGIVGVLIIVLILYLMITLGICFIQKKSWQGVLLLSIVVYWASIANFLVFLEVPYHAIPFWSLVGTLWAYKNHLENRYA